MSPPPENSFAQHAQAGSVEAGEYSSEDRRTLLKLVHEAIASALGGRQISLEAPAPHLSQPHGVFTTLYHRGQLRGCVGHVTPVSSLYRTVAETARAAAFDDPRFPPLTHAELPDLAVSLSILSPLSPIRPEEIEIGRHGLLISQGAHRGLLLPQVATEHHWDRATFLEHTCRKAGLPTDAWQKGASIEAFTAEVFSDENV